MKQISIATEDGTCPAFTFEPPTGGVHPGVILFIDGIGMRPALHPIAQRIADHGYFVLMPDLFYRAGAYTAPDPHELFTNPEAGKAWFAKVFAHAQQPLIMRDVAAFLGYLTAQPNVVQPRVGVTGYCMGGGLALAAAAYYPDRIVAAAACHPGGLATDAPTSVHLLAPKTKARVYVGGAADDKSFPDDQKHRLELAYTAAGTDATVVTYPAKHGWVPSDTPVHDPVQAERHFEALFTLFDATLS